MNYSSVHHEAKSAMAYAYDQETVHLRLRAKKGLINSVTLIAGDPFEYRDEDGEFNWVKFEDETPLVLEATTAQHDVFFIAIKPPHFRVKYAFILNGDMLYGTRELIDLKTHPELKTNLFNYFNFPYLLDQDRFKAPSWAHEQVWYSIFPSRFHRHDDAPEDKALAAWDDIQELNNHKRFGGTLKGITEKLDYIQSMGFTALYLTPIFKAGSQHKYDTVDYKTIDPEFGTNDDLIEMVEKAHQKGMKVVLDAVFNHTSVFHPWFQDVIQNGPASKYADYYYIRDLKKPVLPIDVNVKALETLPYRELIEKTKDHPMNYLMFGFTPYMPKINCDHPEVREAFLDVTRYWMETAHIDGWRLDVSNEVSHDFWRTFRKTVKSINEDAIIIGENWDNSNPWLSGDQYDAVMNYGLLFPLWQTFGSIPEMPAYDAQAFVEAVNALWVTYPKHVARSMYNLVDSHDTSRMLSLTGRSIDRFKQAYLFLFAYPGSPSVFYGDEVGLDGNHDPDNRKPMPWGRFNDEIQSWFRWLSQWRHEEDALKSDDFSLTSEGDIITMRRQNLTILWNLGDDTTLSDNQTRMRMDARDSILKKDGYAVLKKNLS